MLLRSKPKFESTRDKERRSADMSCVDIICCESIPRSRDPNQIPDISLVAPSSFFLNFFSKQNEIE